MEDDILNYLQTVKCCGTPCKSKLTEKKCFANYDKKIGQINGICGSGYMSKIL